VLEKPPTKKGGEPVEDLLKMFGQFDFFGERALLKSEPRFCSVRVASKQLKTFTITQLTFEETMGKTLSDLLPDYY
jgi:CRP-like cAMP-binding protein